MDRASAPPTAHLEKPTRFRPLDPSPCGLKHLWPLPSPGLSEHISSFLEDPGWCGKHHLPLLPLGMGLCSVPFILPGPTASPHQKASSFSAFPLLLPWPRHHVSLLSSERLPHRVKTGGPDFSSSFSKATNWSALSSVLLFKHSISVMHSDTVTQKATSWSFHILPLEFFVFQNFLNCSQES